MPCRPGRGGNPPGTDSGSLAVTVVYYARRQDALIASWYNEMVKSGYFREGKPLDEEFLTGVYPMALFNHARMIKPWGRGLRQGERDCPGLREPADEG